MEPGHLTVMAELVDPVEVVLVVNLVTLLLVVNTILLLTLLELQLLILVVLPISMVVMVELVLVDHLIGEMVVAVAVPLEKEEKRLDQVNLVEKVVMANLFL